WQGRALARLGRGAEARALFVHVAERHFRSYYAGLAEERLGWRDAAREPPATDQAPPFPGELAGSHAERARILAQLGLARFARLELDAIPAAEAPRRRLLEAYRAVGAVGAARLLRQYDGATAKALAAYNGGEDAVAKWERRYAGRAPDEFVELISFRETRDYVKSVLRNYRAYRRLYAAASPATTSVGSPPKAPFDMMAMTSPGRAEATR